MKIDLFTGAKKIRINMFAACKIVNIPLYLKGKFNKIY